MPGLDRWFADFVGRLVDVLPRNDWPNPSSEFWLAYRRAIDRAKLTEPMLDEAIQRLAEAPPQYLDRVLPELLARAREAWTLAAAAGRVEVSSRDDAHLCSRACPDCCGDGWAIRYRHESREPNRPESIAFYCLCPMGRWLRQAHEAGPESGREAARRIPDLAEHPRLHLGPVPWSPHPDNRHRYPKHRWDAARDRPIEPDYRLPPRPAAALAKSACEAVF